MRSLRLRVCSFAIALATFAQSDRRTITGTISDPAGALGAGTSVSGIRSPSSVVQLLPGSYFSTDASVRINGNPTNSQATRIDGQDAPNGWYSAQSQTQSSVDSIPEFAIQTSNYSAEFGL